MNKRFLLPTFLLIISAAIYLLAASSKAQMIEPLNLKVSDIITDTVETFPRVNITNSDSLYLESLFLEKLEINVKVIGNVAVTTFDMTFFNDSKRLLEGELVFPLAEGQTVSRFAMDVEGKLREAVPVEKEKGRIAFESTVRKNIDPGLLEKSEGNMFKARVYPIPAQGRKHIVMAYEHELKTVEELRIYYLPLLHSDEVKDFRLTAQIFNQDQKPYQKTKGLAEEFLIGENQYVLDIVRQNFKAEGPIFFQLPTTQSTGKPMVEKKDSVLYFSANIKPDLFESPITPPQNLSVFWDVSHSRSNPKVADKELEALRLSLNAWKPKRIDFIFFSNAIHQTKTVEANQWEAIETLVKSQVYDGGTQWGCLNSYEMKTSTAFLFSDGLTNFGNATPTFNKKQIWVFNASSTADHSRLRKLANQHQGMYFNLAGQEQIDPKQFGVWSKHKLMVLEGDVEEVYPKTLVKSESKTITVLGKLKASQTRLKLKYVNPFAPDKANEITIKLKPQAQKTESGLIPRMWAQKKLHFLALNKDENKDEITDLGKVFGLVTDNTSLIVLDRIEDYVQHGIAPPQELIAEYNQLVSNQEKTKENEVQNHLDKVYAAFKEKINWYGQRFSIPERKKALGDDDISSLNRGAYTSDTVVSDTRQVRLRSNDGLGATDSQELVVVHDLNANAVEEADEVENGRADDAYERNENQPPPPELEIVEDNEIQEEVLHYYSASPTDNSNGVTLSTTRNLVIQEGTVSFAFGDGNFKEEGTKNTAKPSITLSEWDPKTPYLKSLRKANSENRYSTYLELKTEHSNQPSFYLDVADVFLKQKDTATGVRVLSNVAELGYENHTLLRILAHRLEQLGQNSLAISSFERVKDLRPEEPQSFRDLGLMYAENNELQKGVDMLYHVIKTPWNGRFDGIESTVATEMNHVIANADSSLDISSIDKRFILAMPTDLRVVLNWDTDNCDMDLWVTDPNGEKCMYSHKKTSTGGRLSNDFTQGYGPEEFLIKKALQGKYKVQVNYFGSRSQKLSGPTTVQVSLTTNYGKPNQKTIQVTRRLSTQKEVLNIGDFGMNMLN